MRLDALAPDLECSALDRGVDMYLAILPEELPGYLESFEGLSYDLFGIAADGDAERARHWLARHFIPEILPRVTAHVLGDLCLARIGAPKRSPDGTVSEGTRT